jgi:hypothetical protein
MPVALLSLDFYITAVAVLRSASLSHGARENVKDEKAVKCEENVKYEENSKGEKKEEKQTPEFDANGNQPGTLNLSGYTLVQGIKTSHAFDNTVPLVNWMSTLV